MIFHDRLRSHRAQAMTCVSENTLSQGNNYLIFFLFCVCFWHIYVFCLFEMFWREIKTKTNQKILFKSETKKLIKTFAGSYCDKLFRYLCLVEGLVSSVEKSSTFCFAVLK